MRARGDNETGLRSFIRGTATALLLIIAALCWWLAFSQPDRNARRASTEVAPSPSPPVQAAAAPPPEPASAAPAPAAPAAPAARATAATLPAAPAALLMPPDTRGFIDALGQRFEADARDPAAAADEVALRQLVQRIGAPASLLRSVACRRSMCKLELHWTAEHDALFRRFTEILTGNNAKFLAMRAGEPDATGAMQVESYWVRRPLPDVPR